MRPVNLRTDLAPLADLIELVFADSMDSNGRAALREMRLLSKWSVGLPLLAHINETATGIDLGYVWIEDGKLVGNVSVYPARWPAGLGGAWIIANVGVHPDYQRRGIARRLMHASMDMIRARGGKHAILQVDYHNYKAHDLYTQLGFVDERAFSLWRRSGSPRVPIPMQDLALHISHRRRSEWLIEYALAQRMRPMYQGGLGWLRPLHPSFFRSSVWRWLTDLVNLRRLERLVIRHPEDESLLASMWVESGFGAATRLTLLMDEPSREFHPAAYTEALISTAVRRFGPEVLTIEHPYEDDFTNAVLEHYRFIRQRTVMHMRWDAR